MVRKKITLIQLDSATPTLVNHVLMPRFGLPLIGTILRDEGYDVQVFVEFISGKLDWDRLLQSDAVCFSSFSSAARRTYELADRIREKTDIPLIIGGTHATHFDASSLEHFDYVVRAEGDEVIVQLLAAILDGKGNAVDVPGISYRINGRVVRNPDAPRVKKLDKFSDYSLIKGYGIPRLRYYLRGYNRVIPVQFSRGCQYHCKFCVVKTMFGPGYRVRDVEAMVDELKQKRKYGRDFMFVDNNFAGDRKMTKQLLRRIIEEKIDSRFFCMCRIEITKDEELLELMKAAGVTQLFFGFESLNDRTLEAFDKRQTREDVVRSVKKVKTYGMEIWGSFVIGLDDDGPDVVRDIVKFSMENEFLNIGMFPVFCYPDVKPECELIPEKRILVNNWDYTSGNFVTYYPKRMKPSTLQRELIDGYRRFYSYGRGFRLLLRGKWRYAAHSIALWIITHRHLSKHQRRYLKYLEDVEKGLYDENEILVESRLEGRTITPVWRMGDSPKVLEHEASEDIPQGAVVT